MPRSNWKGVISFGLVSIPIAIYPTENKAADISFHQIDKRDNARIKYKRINVNTGKEVPWEQITRGYEYEKDEVVPVPDDILKRVAGENSRTIDIEEFVKLDALDILSIVNTYYIVPEKKGEKGYVILREALKAEKKMGIAKVIISTKEYLAAVLAHEDALILCLLKYAKEVRKLSDFDFPTKELSAYKIQKKEIDIAKKLINAMTAKWKPESYKDEYQTAVHKWVEETVKELPHTKMKQRKHPQPKIEITNFVDLLKQSLVTNKSTKKKTKISKHIPLKSKTKATRHTRH